LVIASEPTIVSGRKLRGWAKHAALDLEVSPSAFLTFEERAMVINHTF
jgi:hypothetical protein